MTPQGLRDRFEELALHDSFKGMLGALRSRKPSFQMLSGLVPAACAAYALLLQRKAGRPALVLTGSEQRDNATEMRLGTIMEEEGIPVEKSLEHWYALWGIPF